MVGLTVKIADYASAEDGAAIEALLAEYALDPMGGGEAIPEASLKKVVPGLAARPYCYSVLAYGPGEGGGGGRPLGLLNCIEGFSTFAAAPLVNIHDCAVTQHARGKGVAQRMLAEAETEAVRRGACKLTLEVLEGNKVAKGCYTKYGFKKYELDPQQGGAEFWQKKLSPPA